MNERKPFDVESILKVIVLIAGIVLLFGLAIVYDYRRGVNRNAIAILESNGYTHVDISGTNRLNCQGQYGSTRFYAYRGDEYVRGVLCSAIFSDSVFVREF